MNGTMMSTNDIMKIVTADPFAHVTFSRRPTQCIRQRALLNLAKAIKQQTTRTFGVTRALCSSRFKDEGATRTIAMD